MSGRHRGRATLRWRLVVAVMAAAVGRGYAGRHRLEAAALGLTTSLSAPHEVATAPALPATAPAAAAVAASVAVAATAPARLSVVPVDTAPDPLVDTMPHPVVKLFPMSVVEPAASAVTAEDAVFAAVDRDRDAKAIGDLASSVDLRTPHPVGYHGRHSA